MTTFNVVSWMGDGGAVGMTLGEKKGNQDTA